MSVQQARERSEERRTTALLSFVSIVILCYLTMITAAVNFIYRGGRGRIPDNVTHVTIDESVTVISEKLFDEHPNIVELICHENVVRIERMAFSGCRRLIRVIIPGVTDIEELAFLSCKALTTVECGNLERIGVSAFAWCESLRGINLPSARIVEQAAFSDCEAMEEVTFGLPLESIGQEAFYKCRSLERIAIPLKNDLLPPDDAFLECENLRGINVVEEGVLNETVNALLWDEWRDDMRRKIHSINYILPNAPAGDYENEGGKAIAIREWISLILNKIIHYKALHRGLMIEAEASLMQLPLPDEIVRNNVLPFFELPSHTFDGEDETIVINPTKADELAWSRTRALVLVWPTATESDVTAAEVDTIDEGVNKDGWVRSFLTPVVIFVLMVAFHSNAKNLHVSDIMSLMLLYGVYSMTVQTFLNQFLPRVHEE